MRSQRLNPLLKVMNQRQDAAAQTVAASSRNLVEQEQRYGLLQQYRDDYAIVPVSVATLVSPALLANRQAFRERLDAAVVKQACMVEQTRQNCDAERLRLASASRETRVFEQLAASYRADEAKIEEGRAQRVMDDLGARTSGRNGAGGQGNNR